jgi:hypothetical protein
MKSKKPSQHQPQNLKQVKKSSSDKQKKQNKKNKESKEKQAIQEAIQLRRKDMKLLIAFAVGEKRLPQHSHHPRFLRRTVQDDKCLLWSLNQLRKQIQGLEQALLCLEGDA